MAFEIDPSLLPKFSPALSSSSNDNRSKPSPIVGGLASGFHELVGLGGSAAQGLGALTGIQPLQEAGKEFAASQNATAQRVGRPDLEVAPWQQGGANVAPWLLYQAAKMAPTLGGFFVSGGAAPATEAGAAVARVLPRFLGGLAADAAPKEVAAAAKFITGASAFGGATGFGQAIQSADQKPGGVTASDALKATAESPLYAAAGLLEPGFLRGAMKGAEGNLIPRVITRALSGAGVGAVQSGALAALDQTFRPDLTTQQKMSNIVEAAATGASVGGIFAGATGLRAMKHVDPNVVSTEDLGHVVDDALNLGEAGQNIGRVMLPSPMTFVDAMGRAAPGAQGAGDLLATPREPAPAPEVPQAPPSLFGPTAVPDRAAVPGSTIVVGRRGDQGRFTNEPTGVEQPPVVPEDTSRAYRNFTNPELFSAANALANEAEAKGGRLPQGRLDVAKAVQDELVFRQRNGLLTSDNVVEPTVAAVEPEGANRRGTGEQPDSQAPAAATDLQQRISELTQGLRLPQTLRDKLASARSEDDIQNIVHDESIIEAKGGANRDTLAQRVGLLDSEGRPTPLADQVSTRKAGPEGDAASPTFQRQFADVIKTIGQKDESVRALKPKNLPDAQLQIYRALGGSDVSDAMEQLAQRYGVLDENKVLTPAAVELAQRDPIPTEDTMNAAKAQGFKGSDASMFERGVRAYTGEGKPLDKIANADKAAAYRAGQKFAEETNSVPRGSLKKYDPNGQLVGKVTEGDVAKVEGTAPKPQPRVVPPEVRQNQLVNKAIDNAGLHPTKDEAEIAVLKTQLRSGDIQGAMENLAAVQRGEKLIPIDLSKATEPKPFAGEKITPGAPKGKVEPELQPRKATTRAEAERAIRHYELGKMIDAAHAEGSVSTRDRISLINKLRQGKVGEVIKVVGQPTGKIEGPIAASANRAARRSELLQALQDHLAQSARDAEVPELSVDKNGVLQAAKGAPDNDNERQSAHDVELQNRLNNPAYIAGAKTAWEHAYEKEMEQHLLPDDYNSALTRQNNPGATGRKFAAPTDQEMQRILAVADKAAQDYWQARLDEEKIALSKAAKAGNDVPYSDWVHAGPKDNQDAARVVTHAVDNPTDVEGTVQQIADLGGELGAVAARMKKFVPDGLQIKVRMPQEMNELERQMNVLDGYPAAPITGKLWGLYSSADNTIYLHLGAPHPAIVLHEVAHAIVGKHIAADTPIGREIKSIFNRFKDGLRNKNDYAGIDAQEFMAEFISRKSVRDFVKSQGDGKGNIFQRAWDVVRKALGMPPRDYVERLFDLAEAAGRQPLDEYGLPIYPKMLGQTPPALNRSVEDTISKVNDFVDEKLKVGEGLRGAFRRSMLYATTAFHIAEHFGDWFNYGMQGGRNGLRDRLAHTDFREAFQQRKSQILMDLMDKVYAFESHDGDGYKSLNKMMGLTQLGIHPGREWDQQLPQVQANPALKDAWQKGRNWYRSLQTKNQIGLYHDLRKFNDMVMLMNHAMSLHDEVSADRVTQGRIAEFAVNPARRFMDEQAAHGYGLDQAHKFWLDEVNNQAAALRAWADTNEADPATLKMSAKDRRLLNSGIKSVRSYADAVGALKTKLDAVPYFHLGRDGDYIVDMKLRLGKDGHVDPAAMAEVADRLKQWGVVVAPESGADHVFIRVDNTVAQRNLQLAAEQLQKEGVVRKDYEDDNGRKTFGILAGKRTDDRIQSRLATQWSERIISEIRANEHLSPEDKAALTAQIRSQAIDLMPDNSLAKVMSHRDNVPGFDPDMIKSYNARAKISIDATAGMAIARDMTTAYGDMRESARQARGASTSQVSTAQRNGMTEVIDEMSRRDKQFADQPKGSKLLNQMQAFSGAFFLSANIAYPTVNLVQVPMLALPRLGSKYGYVRSAKAMGAATGEALKIIKAIAANGLKVSASRAADAVLTMQSLKDAGITGRKAEFIMQVANRGGVDIGGPSRELARNARGVRGDKVDQSLRMASALGYYSETLSRLVVGLAEYRLHDPNLALDEMADRTVNTLKSSMWDYSSPNTSRMLSRSGFLGPLTPLATQFMKYTAMLTETLYRETHKALGGDAEAARFLAGHLAMTTVFAGTLGLPFATVFAAAYDKLKDLLAPGDQPSDIMNSYRNGLADMFGKGAAEIIARGTPRAAGIDLSTRVGEQDIFPFSKFIADRRDLKDSLKDLEARAWGAPSSMLTNMTVGAQQVAQGDLVGGFRMMLPLGLSSMVKAYQMTDQGFTDAKGNVLPMTPSARDVLAQAVGFNPAQNAEYSEARMDQQVRSGLLQRQSAQMRGQIVKAMIAGDHDTARELISQAIEFDREHPAYSVLNGVEGAIEARRKAAVISQRFGTPLGVNPKDTYAPQFTRYADVEMRAQ